ncbi:nucleoside-diphosphate kinase [Candidatus Woesearchaeota archaeon]|jgi:nucleoside-diphosphate kinase|nr:nucleoside-diphosphate kinase [Candidatus Woesearchaeota archaeon]MBT5397159.1 nucleoside-diphosphate kinase [Candidatus Woesearchaeota archaeon]MBT6367295.1 nucleoside-diphosphate kinase [Candidatus Woesearchaeota archaeon]MBT7762559.1 nucleoside-diphosphate kinase [Candidatus Woesearchaeota archaeon]
MKTEQTLILAKQDSIHRGLVGEIIRRFEQKGMKLVGLKLVIPTADMVGRHYPDDDAMWTITGERTIETWKEKGRETDETPLQVGKRIRDWNINSLTGHPVIAMCFEGYHAVEVGRKIVGHTEPRQALPGTIRGDLSVESYDLADFYKRPLINLVHAAGKQHEAEREIKVWFKDDELFDYTKRDFKMFHSFDQ